MSNPKEIETPKSNSNSIKIAIIGLGYVGLPLALLADKKGYSVIGLDINKDLIGKINDKKSPLIDSEIASQLSSSNLKATDDFSLIKDSKVIIVCVPTPVNENFQPDLSPVINACKSVGKFISFGQLIVLESTVNPGVCEEIVIPILEKVSGLKAGRDFHIAHCPERINPGDPRWSISNIPRVIGSLEPKGLELALQFYNSIVEAEIKPMASLKEAEAVKIIENSFRDVNIAFVNELAMSFSRLGIDIVRVIEGASTKPFAFLAHFPGCGVGGHCIPVDPYYLIEYAKNNGLSHRFLSLAREINNDMPKFTVDSLVNKLKEKNINPAKAKIAVLGLAYKPDIGDDRESPAYKIIEHLNNYGIKVASYDPYVNKGTAPDIDSALKGAYGVIIATAHKEFKELKPEFIQSYGIKVVVDGRNCLNKESFSGTDVLYLGIGR